MVEGVHQAIPDEPVANQPVYIAPAPPAAAQVSNAPPAAGTEADRLRAQYKAVGDAQGHKFGEGLPGAKPADFNLKVPVTQPGAAPAGAAKTTPAPAVQAPKPASPPPTTSSPPATRTAAPPAPAAPAPPSPVPPAPSDDVAQRPHNQ